VCRCASSSQEAPEDGASAILRTIRVNVDAATNICARQEVGISREVFKVGLIIPRNVLAYRNRQHLMGIIDLQKHHPLIRHTGGLVVGVTSVFEKSSGNITTVVVGFVVLLSLDPCGTTFQG